MEAQLVKIGQCFDDRRAKHVSIGESFVFSLRLHDEQELHIVDSPAYGRGLYIFDTFEDAKAWANRTIDHIEARKRASAIIVHNNSWRERMYAQLESA